MRFYFTGCSVDHFVSNLVFFDKVPVTWEHFLGLSERRMDAMMITRRPCVFICERICVGTETGDIDMLKRDCVEL